MLKFQFRFMKKNSKMWSAFYCFYIIYSAENELSKKTLNTILNIFDV